MKRQFFKYIGFLFLACFAINANAQSIAEAKLKDYNIKIGEQTKLFLTVHQPAKDRVVFPKIVDTITGKILVVSAAKPDTAFDQNDHNRLAITQSYLITCFDAGTYTIPPFKVTSGKDTLKTNELSLQVQTVKVDTTKAIYDIKQPLVVSYTFFDWLKDNWIWVLLALAIIAAIKGLIYYLSNRAKKIPVIVPMKKVLSIQAIALNKLRDLRERKLWQQNEIKLYHSELSDVMREYLEKRYQIKTYEKTTEEILSALKYADMAEENRNMLRQILVLADLAKFAKEKPLPAENEQSMDNAMLFVTRTEPVIEPAKHVEGGAADEPA